MYAMPQLRRASVYVNTNTIWERNIFKAFWFREAKNSVKSD